MLGILWNKEADTLGISIIRLKELYFEKATKKNMLSVGHEIFDPIGTVCPVLLFPKHFCRDCSMKLNWEKVDSQTVVSQTEFLKWLKNISDLGNVRIPRYFHDKNAPCISFLIQANMLMLPQVSSQWKLVNLLRYSYYKYGLEFLLLAKR